MSIIKMNRKTINPPSLFDSREHGFSQIVISTPGKAVFISGQVAWDEHRNIIGENDLGKQIQKTLDNLGIAIEEAGGSIEDIVMLRIYKVNLQEKDGQIISDALKHFFGSENPPASSWVSVQGLANKNFLIEIEAEAIIQ